MRPKTPYSTGKPPAGAGYEPAPGARRAASVVAGREPDDVAARLVAGDFTVTLFDCHGLVPCTDQMEAVTIPGTANYRHRVFEQVIPLRNQVWNPS